MITSISFINFKLLRNVVLELGRINVIVGRNGVGKSTALEGTHLLLQLATERPGEDSFKAWRPGALFVGPRSTDLLLSKPDATFFELGVSASAGVRFHLHATPTPRSEAAPDQFKLTFEKGGKAEQITLPGPSNPKTFFKLPYQERLGAVVRLKLHAEALAADHYSEREEPRLEYSGAGLPSVLQYLQGLRDGTLEQIEGDLARVVPGVRRIRTLPVRIRRQERVRVTVDGQESWLDQWREFTGSRFEVEFDGLGWIQAAALSEGTLLALGLITLLRHKPPRLVLLDDLDKALHPMAQRDLIGLIRKVLEDLPDVQIVATSHSPFVLDALDATEVFVAGSLGAGASAIRRLDQHPAWQKRKGFMHPGEFWSAVGEGWVRSSAPAEGHGESQE